MTKQEAILFVFCLGLAVTLLVAPLGFIVWGEL